MTNPLDSLRVIDGGERTHAPDVRGRLEETADVVIVGSGPAGAAVAARTARSGLSTCIVEEGALHRPGADPPDAFGSMAALYRKLGTTVTRGRAPMPYLQGCAVGGTSVVNGAISWRLPRYVWREWVESDPALADAIPWARLCALFDEIEARLGIAPTEARIAGPNNHLMARGAAALGLQHRPIRRNVRGCRGLGQCLQACPEGHKQSMERTLLVDACSDGARILCRARVDALETWHGRVTAACGVLRSGRAFRVRARHAVVLAASAVHTPVILLASGLRDGAVGRGFQCHPGVSVAGRFEEPVRIWTGATQGHEVVGLRHEGLKFEALGFDIGVAATRLPGVGRELAARIDEIEHWADWGAAIRATARGRVTRSRRGEPVVRYDHTPGDVALLRRGVAILGRMMFAAGASEVSLGVHGTPETTTDPDHVEAFAHHGSLDARSYAAVATHLFGTCRMGSDPARSVVGPGFEHHRVDRLFVADSSVFPSNTGVNPQTSIIALASLCGESVVSS